MKSKQKILVTGSKGFIGSAICKELEKRELGYKGIEPEDGYNLYSLQEVIRLHGDYETEVVIHCAAISHIPLATRNPNNAFFTNILSTFNFLEISRLFQTRVIYVSSASIYGDFDQKIITEEDLLKPKEFYGATKACSDLLTQSYYKTYKAPTTVIRTSSVYGDGDTHLRVVRKFFEDALNQGVMTIQGTGNLRRDFTYIKDLAKGIIDAALSPKTVGEVLNLTGGNDHSIKELAQLIQELIPGTKIEYIKGRKIDLNRGKLSIEKAKKMIDYIPKYSLKEGLKDMLKDYFKKEKEA